MLMAILQRITFTFTSSTTKVPNICNTLAQRPSRCKVFICFPYLAARRIGSNKHTHGYCTISVGFRNPVIFCNTNQLQKADCTESYESFHFFQLFFCWKHISPIIISKKTQLEDFLDHPQLLGLQRYIFRNIRNIPFDSTGHGTKPWRSRLLFFRVFPQIFGFGSWWKIVSTISLARSCTDSPPKQDSSEYVNQIASKRNLQIRSIGELNLPERNILNRSLNL